MSHKTVEPFAVCPDVEYDQITGLPYAISPKTPPNRDEEYAEAYDELTGLPYTYPVKAPCKEEEPR